MLLAWDVVIGERISVLRDPLVVDAIRSATPLFLPAIPFGLVMGVAITESAMPTAIGWSTNLFIYAGASQLATVSLAATATWLTLVITASVINLRHVMYSAALSPRFATSPRGFAGWDHSCWSTSSSRCPWRETSCSSGDWRRF